MLARRELCHPYQSDALLSGIIVRLWLADLMYIFDIETMTELQRALDGVRYRFSRDGTEAICGSELYLKYHKGWSIPSRKAIRWLAKYRCPQAGRVFELSLWEALTLEPTVDRRTNDVAMYGLSDTVKDVVFQPIAGSQYMIERALMDTDDMIDALGRIGTVDALTAMIVLFKERSAMVEPDEEYAVLEHAQGALAGLLRRLCAFAPFYDVRHELCRYFDEYVFVREPPVEDIDDGEQIEPRSTMSDGLDRYICSIREMMAQMIGLGLVDNGFIEQMNFLQALHRLFPEHYRVIDDTFRAREFYWIAPGSLLWEVLQAINHPATATNDPVALPLINKVRSSYRFANALGKAVILSRGASSPFTTTPTIARRCRSWCFERLDLRLAPATLHCRSVRDNRY